jgi:hypothetical protein
MEAYEGVDVRIAENVLRFESIERIILYAENYCCEHKVIFPYIQAILRSKTIFTHL